MPGLAIDFSLRIVAAAAAVGLVLLVFRVRSGAARHAAWSGVLLTMLTMPVLTAIVPRIEVPVPSRMALDPGAVAASIDWNSAATEGAATRPEFADVRQIPPALPQTSVPGIQPVPHTATPWWRLISAVYAIGVADDPQGFAEAVRRWDTHLRKPGFVLATAAIRDGDRDATIGHLMAATKVLRPKTSHTARLPAGSGP